MPEPQPAHKRILLKLSGEALMGDDQFGINRATIVRMVEEVAEVVHMGVEVAGGRFMRQYPGFPGRTGQQPVEERGAGIAEVQMPGGTRRESRHRPRPARGPWMRHDDSVTRRQGVSLR